jgi:hypothetical protein
VSVRASGIFFSVGVHVIARESCVGECECEFWGVGGCM